MKKAIYLCVVLATLLLPGLAFAQYDIPEKPSFQTSVYDYANILTANEKQELEDKLVRYSDTTSTQIVVITIKSLKGESIGELTPKWAHQWGIGQADKDNGVLILLAEAEHKIWISPGYGVDDRLTAGELGQMIRDVIIPEFKAGSYYDGLNKGTDAIFQMLTGKYKGQREGGNRKESDVPLGKIIFFIFIGLFVLISIFKGRGGGGRGGRGGFTGSTLGDILVLSSLGRGFGGSGRSGGWGSSGGGFGGGFGGGGFSGGGAGGSW